jgi:Fur family ferric uptake transcriptional regulator
MEFPERHVTEFLRQRGLSVTAGRILILKYLWQQKPMTIAQLIDKVDGRVDRASVYRAVSLFEQLGMVRRISVGWKYQIELSGEFSAHHHHLHCINCQAVIPITDDSLEDTIAAIGQRHRFVPTEHQLEIQGVCRQCSRKKRRH